MSTSMDSREPERVRASAACLLEGTIVSLARLGPAGQAEFGLLLDAFGIEVVSLTHELAVFAAEAWSVGARAGAPRG